MQTGPPWRPTAVHAQADPLGASGVCGKNSKQAETQVLLESKLMLLSNLKIFKVVCGREDTKIKANKGEHEWSNRTQEIRKRTRKLSLKKGGNFYTCLTTSGCLDSKYG